MINKKEYRIFGFVLSVLLLFSSCSGTSGRQNDITLIPVWNGDSCYYIHTNDEIAFSELYPNVSLFREGVALIQTPGRDSRMGYIDESGELVLPAVYKRATYFSEDRAWVVRPGEAPGMINHKGELKFTFREAVEVYAFQEGMSLFSVREGRTLHYGYLNREGDRVVEPVFADALSFSGKMAAVKDAKGRWGFIDKDGNVVIPCSFDEVSSFTSSGYAAVKMKNKWGIIDRKGEYLTEPAYSALYTDGNLFIVKQGKLWGWCDKNGETVIPPLYEQVFGFWDNELAPVKIDGKWGYIDRKGVMAVKRQFDMAYPFVGNLAAVKIGDYYGFINPEGRYEINPQYTGLSKDYEANAICGGSVYDKAETDKK